MPSLDLSLDGERLHADLDLPRDGQGPWPGVMLAHGMLSCAREFQDLPDRLNRAGYAVLSFDFRGCGQSQGLRGRITKERWVADWRTALSALRERREVDAACIGVVGHSMGGMTTLAGCAAFDAASNDATTSVKALVAACSPLSIREQAPWKDRLLGGIAYRLTRPLDALLRAPLTYPNPVRYDQMCDDPILARELEDQNIILRRMPLLNYPSLMRFACGEDAARGKIPALFLAGAKDTLVMPATTRRLHDLYGGPKEWAELPDSGHSIFADRDKVLAGERVIAFFDRHVKG